MPAPREVLAERLRLQAGQCSSHGSFFYAALLEYAAADLDMEGAVWGVLQGFETESLWTALTLRFMGALHRLVLQPIRVARWRLGR